MDQSLTERFRNDHPRRRSGPKRLVHGSLVVQHRSKIAPVDRLLAGRAEHEMLSLVFSVPVDGLAGRMERENVGHGSETREAAESIQTQSARSGRAHETSSSIQVGA